MIILSKDEAIKKGLNKFYTGFKCKHGHCAYRFVSDNMCQQCRYNQYRNQSRYKSSKTYNNVPVEGVSFFVYSGNVITKKEAISLNLKRYFTGLPCKRGHISERYVFQSSCCECLRLRDIKNKERAEKRRLRKERSIGRKMKRKEELKNRIRKNHPKRGNPFIPC